MQLINLYSFLIFILQYILLKVVILSLNFYFDYCSILLDNGVKIEPLIEGSVLAPFFHILICLPTLEYENGV